MKRNAIACIALAAATFTSAANYIKDINNGKYEKTLKKIEKKLAVRLFLREVLFS